MNSSAREIICKCIVVILLFMYIFDFELIKGVSYSRSSIVAIVISLIVVIFSKSNRQLLNSIFQASCMKFAIALSFILTIYSFIIIFLHQTGDYSLLFSIIRSVIWIGASAVLCVAIKRTYQGSILDLLIYVMLAQSVVIVLSMLFPEFKSMTDAFRSDNVIERGEMYSGYRALGISGSAFFGLAICYGFIFLLIAYHWKNWSITNPVLRVAVIILLIVAGSSAGRTSQIGLIFGVLLFIVLQTIGNTHRHNKVKKKNIVIVSLFLAVAISSVPFLGQISISGTVEYFIAYATSFFANFNPSDILSSTSSTQTLSTMYFPLSFDQLIVGDGLYEVNGFYYMDTDAGYMRTVLYFGVPGLLLMCGLQFSLLYMGSEKKEILFYIFIVLLLLIFQYKGEAILTPISLASLSFLAALDIRAKLYDYSGDSLQDSFHQSVRIVGGVNESQ